MYKSTLLGRPAFSVDPRTCERLEGQVAVLLLDRKQLVLRELSHKPLMASPDQRPPTLTNRRRLEGEATSVRPEPIDQLGTVRSVEEPHTIEFARSALLPCGLVHDRRPGTPQLHPIERWGRKCADRLDRMFTIEQIDDIHDRLGNADTLVEYLRSLNAIGVERSDSFLADGHTEYFGKNRHKVVTAPAHEMLTIAERGNRQGLLEHLSLHNQGKTDYLEMSKGLAESGIAKWTFDTTRMTIAYYDRAGNEMLVEAIR